MRQKLPLPRNPPPHLLHPGHRTMSWNRTYTHLPYGDRKSSYIKKTDTSEGSRQHLRRTKQASRPPQIWASSCGKQKTSVVTSQSPLVLIRKVSNCFRLINYWKRCNVGTFREAILLSYSLGNNGTSLEKSYIKKDVHKND